MSLESAKVNFNIFLFVATEARNLSDIFVESFRLHMLSRFLFIYQLNDCKQINSYHIFSEKLKSYKAVYKYAKKKPKPCLELLCCRGKEQLKMRNKTRLSLCQNPSWRTDGVGVGWRSACIQTEKICRYYDPGGWFWYFTISILELSLSKGLGRKRKICGSIALIKNKLYSFFKSVLVCNFSMKQRTGFLCFIHSHENVTELTWISESTLAKLHCAIKKSGTFEFYS